MITELDVVLSGGIVTELEILQGLPGPPGTADNISGLIQAGTNVTLTGGGTLASPFVISATGGGGGSGTVTSIAISGTGLTVTGSPITESGTITLAVIYGTTAGTACQGNDARLSNARTPTAHKSTHATGGSDPLTPADIGALATSDADVFETPDKIVKRSATGTVQATALFATGSNPTISISNTSDGSGVEVKSRLGEFLFRWYDSTGSEYLVPISFSYPSDDYTQGLKLTLDSELGSDVVYQFPPGTGAKYMVSTSRTDHQLPPDSVVTEAADFTLSQATHWRKWVRLTKTGSTQTITLPTSGIDTGCVFQFFRATSQSLQFSGGTVNGTARLADVVQNSAFGLVYLGSGTYDFI